MLGEIGKQSLGMVEWGRGSLFVGQCRRSIRSCLGTLSSQCAPHTCWGGHTKPELGAKSTRCRVLGVPITQINPAPCLWRTLAVAFTMSLPSSVSMANGEPLKKKFDTRRL